MGVVREGLDDHEGYAARKLPAGTLIHAAPAEDPQRPLSKTEHIAWLRNKGVEVIENSDGRPSSK